MTTDLAETIERWRRFPHLLNDKVTLIDTADLADLLDAAEAGMRARDAALEEAAALIGEIATGCKEQNDSRRAFAGLLQSAVRALILDPVKPRKRKGAA